MKRLKALLFNLLLLLASAAWCAEIHDAALKGDLAKVKELLAKDPALVERQGPQRKSPAPLGRPGRAPGDREIPDRPGARRSTSSTSRRRRRWSTPPRSGHLKLVELLIAKGTNVNIKTTLDASPIHYALWSDRTDVVKLLLKKGADFRVSRGEGFTLLHEAAGGESVEIVDLLLKKGHGGGPEDRLRRHPPAFRFPARFAARSFRC